MTKRTKKEMYSMISAIFDPSCETPSYSPEEIVEFCEKEIFALERKAEKAKERSAQKKAESDKLLEAVFAALTEDFQTIAEITEAVEVEDATPSKVSYRLNALVKADRAVKQEMTIPAAEGGKSRKVQSYALA